MKKILALAITLNSINNLYADVSTVACYTLDINTYQESWEWLTQTDGTVPTINGLWSTETINGEVTYQL